MKLTYCYCLFLSFLTDYSHGFGGKFGVQKDRQDKTAAGWDHIEKVEKHESQVDHSKVSPFYLSIYSSDATPCLEMFPKGVAIAEQPPPFPIQTLLPFLIQPFPSSSTSHMYSHEK